MIITAGDKDFADKTRWIHNGKYGEELMEQEQEAVSKLSRELFQLFLEKFGKEPDLEVVRAEAENLVSRYGPIGRIKDIFRSETE
jgi:hypothetical protein